ncbi:MULTISPECIES: UPF0280 family protein [unclassified Oceanispirochaeta]|uniref:UPF0280 family protein n=1 Tax=unclassified Oceanispirochaeta TaxID=2635722 RepID=UPI000E08E5AB|nr:MULTISPECIES: UPF0280 family protein [unclassified Oceanispirochaeta]MBF9018939.1 UPF0280 family protein [Oceanispirochaeta sp. M2]NPD75459.1 UPF0280 family protein [Oceanispirochaeta sp. M1]RDG28687.1 UPF0280 family protein [Oceanispirochaeta sp. M1]
MSLKRKTPGEFHFKDAHFHILTEAWDDVCSRIIAERLNLEAFIGEHPGFQSSLIPLDIHMPDDLLPDAVRRMQYASRLTGLGPMAAVAGTMAQLAAETSKALGSSESIVENGGDLYLDCRDEVILGLYTGKNSQFENLALKIPGDMMPLAVCTSSGRMGHSLSYGDCDLVTVFSKDGSLADAAATLGCNSVKTEDDIEPVLNRLLAIDGILGAIIIRDDRFGAVGEIPELIKTLETDIDGKVSRDDMSNFQQS